MTNQLAVAARRVNTAINDTKPIDPKTATAPIAYSVCVTGMAQIYVPYERSWTCAHCGTRSSPPTISSATA